MTLLIISLPTTAANHAAVFDYVQSLDASTVTSNACVPLALMPAVADRHTEVVAVVPAQALSWHQVQLPQGSVSRSMFGERGATRLRAILDGLLEDQLLDETTHLHLALQPNPTSAGPVWVAACDRVWLKTHITALAGAGYPVSRIVPEITPQGLVDVLFVTGDPQHAQISGMVERRSASGEVVGTGVLTCALSAASAALFEGSIPQVFTEPAVAELAEHSFNRPVTLLHSAQRLLLATQSPWNLAQFDVANARRDSGWHRFVRAATSVARAPQWRAARWALLVLVLGNLIGLNALALREQSLLNAKRQAVRAVLTDTFPKIPVVVDAPVQMARELAVLQRASGSSAGADMESMLSAFSGVAQAEFIPTAIEYGAGELRLTGPTVPGQDPAQLNDVLKPQGLTVSQQGNVWTVRAGVAP